MYDLDNSAALRVSKSLTSKPKICKKLNDVFPLCDLVFEAASVRAAAQVCELALKKRKPIILMSTGGFLQNREKLTRLAKQYKTKIYLPSGALCGLDGLKAARQIGKFKNLKITSTKPPRGFEGAPGLSSYQQKKLRNHNKPFYLYKGNVWEAIKRFPANVNVAATLALASGELDKLQVWVRADPNSKFNQHEIFAEGEFGELRAVTRNVPSALNPKTSALAIEAALGLIERLESYVEVGT